MPNLDIKSKGPTQIAIILFIIIFYSTIIKALLSLHKALVNLNIFIKISLNVLSKYLALIVL